MERPIYCFIDDSSFEIGLFHEIFQPSFPEIEFLCTSTFDECKKLLDARNLYPSLFILDLYGRSGNRVSSTIPSKTEIQTKVNSFNTLEDVYHNLDYNDPNITNEYLKRLFSILDSWRNLFADVCYSLDQGREYGISNLQSAREYYPLSAAVIYTRKAMLTDAAEIFNQDCDGIFIKPMGSNDDEIKNETKAQLNTLISSWNEIVRNKYVKVFENISKEVIINTGNSGLNPSISSLVNLLKTVGVEEEKEINLKTRLKDILETLPSVIHGVSNTSEFLTGLKLWSLYYYKN
ncbi:MAG: hypothetical protein GXO85_00765 [Chlorobi bacterium]|nr:hypothetical protein [Chlorobiota bacterium]